MGICAPNGNQIDIPNTEVVEQRDWRSTKGFTSTESLPTTDIIKLKKPRNSTSRERDLSSLSKDTDSTRTTPTSSLQSLGSSAYSVNWSNTASDGLGSGKRTREEMGMLFLEAVDAEGVDVSKFTTIGGRTALMFAVITENLNNVKLLIQKKADPLETNDKGETPLSLAKGLKSGAIYKYLYEKIPLE